MHGLRAITIEAAYSWRMERELGSVAVGKLAHFTVLSEDPYAVDPERLPGFRCWTPSLRDAHLWQAGDWIVINSVNSQQILCQRIARRKGSAKAQASL